MADVLENWPQVAGAKFGRSLVLDEAKAAKFFEMGKMPINHLKKMNCNGL